MINNVKKIKELECGLIYKKWVQDDGQIKWSTFLKDYYDASHRCMKEYIIQKIHAGKKITITGETMVIE